MNVVGINLEGEAYLEERGKNKHYGKKLISTGRMLGFSIIFFSSSLDKKS